jgi:hypothetical protein
MEDLIELVAASFARHGIECPTGDHQRVERWAPSPVPETPGHATRVIEPTLTSALPEHNFRKSLQGDPAP